MKKGLNKSNLGGVERKVVNKRKKNKSSVAKLPNGKNDASSNWKSLLEELKSERRRKGLAKRTGSEPKFSKKNSTKQQEASNYEKRKPDIWFDDVDEMLLDPEDRESTVKSVNIEAGSSANTSKGGLVKEKSFSG